MKYIKKLIDEYWIDNVDSFKITNIEIIKNLHDKYMSLNALKKDIDNGIVTNNIIRYIVPQFYINKYDENEQDKIEYLIDNI